MMGYNSRGGMSKKVIKELNVNGGCGMSRIMNKGCNEYVYVKYVT